MKQQRNLDQFNIPLGDNSYIDGFCSKPDVGAGRGRAGVNYLYLSKLIETCCSLSSLFIDRQNFYVNGRPIEMSKIQRAFNEGVGNVFQLQVLISHNFSYLSIIYLSIYLNIYLSMYLFIYLSI